MYKNILLAVALQGSDEPNSHAMAARDVAVSMASEESKKVNVLTVYSLERIDGHHDRIPTVDDLELGGSVANKERQSHEIDRIQKIEEQVNSVLAHFVVELHNRSINTESIIKEGNPRDLIVQTAEEIGADLIIMGAHARRSFLDVLLGGTAQAVVNNANCAIIMVRPSK